MTGTALEITTPPNEPIITWRRFVKAPPELIFEAMTKAEHLRHWWGPRNLQLVVCESDPRVGGKYRLVHRAPDGQEFGFHGEYLELDFPNRIVNTFVFEPFPDNEAIDTVVLEAVDGGTQIIGTEVHDSIASRDGKVASGMEGGMTETYERLDALMNSLHAAAI